MLQIPPGSFVWHNLVTPDTKDAAAFYTEIARWHTQPWEHDDTDYTLFAVDGEPLGGAIAPSASTIDSNGTLPRWLPYAYVYDVDACARQVEKLGGHLRRGPYEVPNVGCWAVVADPQGATIGMFEPTQSPPGHPGAPRRGEFSWHELATTDHRAAFEFYKPLFHWALIEEHDMGEMGKYLIFGQQGRAYGGMFTQPGISPHWLSYVRVDDVSDAAKTAERLGGKVKVGPMEVPGGDWIAQCVDRQGAEFALHTPKA
jgi:predicted enzyme related to lactoylglutathione lyase